MGFPPSKLPASWTCCNASTTATGSAKGTTHLIYNPTLALYFLDYFGRYGRYPRQMLDDNLAMDRNRIQYVARLPHGETLVNQALNDAKPLAVAQLVNRFGVRDMLTAPRNPDFLATLLLRRSHPGRTERMG